MGVDVMRPVYKFEPQYRVTMLMREDWTKATGAPPAVKGLAWYTDGSKMREGTGAGAFGQSVGRRLSFCLGKYATVFQAEIYAILACAHEVQSQNRTERYVSICSDSLAALKALKGVKTTSPGLPVPKGIKLYLYPTCGGPLLGPGTCWNMRQ